MARIEALQPDILLVERTVSRVAQGFLFDAGITLVINVKPVSVVFSLKYSFCKLGKKSSIGCLLPSW